MLEAVGRNRRNAGGSGRGWLATALALAMVGPGMVAAQTSHGESGLELSAQAVGLVTRVAPAFAGRSMTEAYLTQPVLRLSAGGARVPAELTATLNLEGLTLAGGELNPGAWGEGYVDRRHPHTYVHEVMGSVHAKVVGGRVSLSAGKGFAPFGTDDPMARPFVKFPANHHYAQILERAVVVGAAGRGPVALEAGLFNGDEPRGPGDVARLDRFGDSWAARVSVVPGPGVELQASRAHVKSPEYAAGGGLDHRKWSASARYETRASAATRSYALVEWARTDEYSRGRRWFSLGSVLGEAAVRRAGVEVAGRYERTIRPEEERLRDPFRSPRPHADANILGQTRWDIVTLAVSAGLAAPGGLGARSFVEVSRLWATETVRPSAFVPRDFYGSDRLWSVSAGVRVGAGPAHGRMGRYGAARLDRGGRMAGGHD